jgi:site-specific DNA-methyltransferase (adenine-specific)
MGKKWDYDVPSTEIWEECIRVLKPGGHLLSFAGSRTYHRMAVRIEDAGFEIRDQIMWIYGSGFPKSHNIGKSVDKLEGNDREDLGHYMPPSDSDYYKKGFNPTNPNGGICHESTSYGERSKHFTERRITKGNSEWEGWGTTLKPAHEPIVMARKPFSGTVVDNVLEWGIGGINIDGCRIETVTENDPNHRKPTNIQHGSYDNTKNVYGNSFNGRPIENLNPQGRFPANIILDEEAGRILDEQSGFSESTSTKTGYTAEDNIFFKGLRNKVTVRHNDAGGASRFFYCPKTSKNDRNEGVEDKNIHPTVKPTDLMAYLVRLVTPKGGVVLDPFMGSGSTGKGAVREGMVFIGIERESEYFEIAEARIQNEIDNVGKPKKVSKQKETKVEPIVENKFFQF